MKKLILATALLVATTSLAQEAAPQLEEDPRAAKFKEVERGFFTGFEAGFLAFFKTPVSDATKFSFAGTDGGVATGLLVGAHAGYDVTSRLAIMLFGMGGNQRANVSYGAFDIVTVGIDARFSPLVIKDTNEVSRFHVYLHGRGGYLFTQPCGLLRGSNDGGTPPKCTGNNDIMLGAGPGLEYFTRLRHFSIGIAGDFVYLVNAKVPGAAILPTLRYTF